MEGRQVEVTMSPSIEALNLRAKFYRESLAATQRIEAEREPMAVVSAIDSAAAHN